MSIQAIAWAFGVPVTPTQKLVLLGLANYADAQGRCWPSVGRLVERTGLSERAVQMALRAIRTRGLATAQVRTGIRTTYTLALDQDFSAPCGTSACAQSAHAPRGACGGGGHPVRPGGAVSAPESSESFKTVPTNPPRTPQSCSADARSVLWREGVPIVRTLTGKSEGAVRALLGRWLRDLADDCAVLLVLVRQAAECRPLDPVAWLHGAVRQRHRQNTMEHAALSATARVAQEWDLTSFADPSALEAVESLFDPSARGWS